MAIQLPKEILDKLEQSGIKLLTEEQLFAIDPEELLKSWINHPEDVDHYQAFQITRSGMTRYALVAEVHGKPFTPGGDPLGIESADEIEKYCAMIFSDFIENGGN